MAKKAQSGGKKKTILSILAVIAVLAVAAGIGVLAQFLVQQQNNVPQDEGPRLPQVVEDIQNMRSDGTSQEDIDKKLAEALADSGQDDATRYQVYVQQGHIAVDKEDWQAAIDAYTKAESVKQTSETAELIAEAYVKLANNEKAIEYFKKAIVRLEDGVLKDAMKESYEERIRSLGGTP